MIDQIRTTMRTPSAVGIVRAVALLAAQGDIAPGDRLPTIRGLAKGLGVSSSTVGEAWRTLAAQGILDTQGRRGTFLREVTGHEPVRHFRHVFGADVRIDLSTGYPDPELLPDLRPFLRTLIEGPRYEGYPELTMEPELANLLRSLWPFTPQALTLGTDALITIGELLPVLTHYGDRVVIGTSEFAPYLDLFERFGLECIAVPQDEHGLDVNAVAEAVRAGATLTLVQPRVHNPTGLVMSPDRLERIAKVCRDNDSRILEIDHFGRLGSSPSMSAAHTAPLQTVHIRTFSKDLHPDLRVCAFAGPPDVVERVQQRRIGGSWISCVNQRLLAAMLASPDVPPMVLASKTIYDTRRNTFIDALNAHSVAVESRDGFNVWVPVKSEQAALIYLASRGISAAPGSPFQSGRDGSPHIRVSIAQMSDGHEKIADAIANAARTRRLGAHKPNLYGADEGDGGSQWGSAS